MVAEVMVHATSPPE
jgi:predicted benzoate:H+ symporter BenE